MSAIFRAYNDWLVEFCRTDPTRLKGIAMINLDDVEDGIKELERAARLGPLWRTPSTRSSTGATPKSEYEPFWAAAAALGRPLSLTQGDATVGQDPRGRRKDAARRQQPSHQGVLSGAVTVRSDFLRRLRASSPPQGGDRGVRARVGAPHLLSTKDYTTASATAKRFTGSRTACCRATFSAATSS